VGDVKRGGWDTKNRRTRKRKGRRKRRRKRKGKRYRVCYVWNRDFSSKKAVIFLDFSLPQAYIC